MGLCSSTNWISAFLQEPWLSRAGIGFPGSSTRLGGGASADRRRPEATVLVVGWAGTGGKGKLSPEAYGSPQSQAGLLPSKLPS